MKAIVYTIIGVFALIQLIRPDFTNPIVDPKVALHADPEVMGILKTSCYDCHSGETLYPWYHNVAPVSWIMANNIHEGRRAIDFSNWANIDPSVKLKRLERAKQMIHNDMMPKHEYLLMHKNAVLNPQKKETLDHFLDEQIKELGGSLTTMKEINN